MKKYIVISIFIRNTISSQMLFEGAINSIVNGDIPPQGYIAHLKVDQRITTVHPPRKYVG